MSDTEGWILRNANGDIIGAGTGGCVPGPGETVEVSADPINSPENQTAQLAVGRVSQIAKVEHDKTETEYRQKAIESREILTGTAYDPALHPFIAIEVAETGQTPLEVAQSIDDAIKLSLPKAQARIATREEFRSGQ